MKSFGIFLLIVVIVALLTVPGQTKFNNYLAKKGKDAGKCIGPNSTRHYAYKIFSIDYVDYCDPISIQNVPNNVGLMKKHTDKYLGLFGMFFKI